MNLSEIYENDIKDIEHYLSNEEYNTILKESITIENDLDRLITLEELALEHAILFNKQSEILNIDNIDKKAYNILINSLESIVNISDIDESILIGSVEAETMNKIKMFVSKVITSFQMVYEKVLTLLSKWIQKIRVLIGAKKEIRDIDRLKEAIKTGKEIEIKDDKIINIMVLSNKVYNASIIPKDYINKLMKKLNLSKIDLTKLSVNMSLTDTERHLKLADFKLVYAGKTTFLIKNKKDKFIADIKLSIEDTKEILNIDKNIKLNELDLNLFMDRKSILNNIDSSYKEIVSFKEKLKNDIKQLDSESEILKLKQSYLELIKIHRLNMKYNSILFMNRNKAVELVISSI